MDFGNLLRKNDRLLMPLFRPVSRLLLPLTGRPKCLPIPVTSAADPAAHPGPMQAPFLPGEDAPCADPVWRKKRFQTSGRRSSVFIQDVGIDVGNHINLGMAGVALSGLQIAVVQL